MKAYHLIPFSLACFWDFIFPGLTEKASLELIPVLVPSPGPFLQTGAVRLEKPHLAVPDDLVGRVPELVSLGSLSIVVPGAVIQLPVPEAKPLRLLAPRGANDPVRVPASPEDSNDGLVRAYGACYLLPSVMLVHLKRAQLLVVAFLKSQIASFI